MKRGFVSLVGLGLVFLALAADPMPPGLVTLTWPYDTNSVTSDLTFYLLSSPDASAPLTNWQTVAVIPATNFPASMTITGSPTVAFFTVFSSNQFGMSSNSNIVTPNAQAVIIHIVH